MPRQKKKSVSRRVDQKPFYTHVVVRKVIFFYGIVLLSTILLYGQYNRFFFFVSGKEEVDFSQATGAYDPAANLAYFQGQTIAVPQLFSYNTSQQVLGDSTGSSKRIEVDLTNQRLYAFEGDTKVFDFLVSTGKWGRTPEGEFEIWTKLRATTMKGGSKALGTYYYLPNVPYTMFFYNSKYPKWVGYGIHGTYWHNNFGHPMSHGCINMKTEEAAQLYYWAHPELRDGRQSTTISSDNSGTRVVIYGTAPKE